MEPEAGIIIPPFPLKDALRVCAFFTTRQFNHQLQGFLRNLLSPEVELFMPIQRHTDMVVTVDNTTPDEALVADAVITNRTDLFVAVQTADCVPVLVYDSEVAIVSAVHAGWRGTAAQILMNTISLMVTKYHCSARDIHIAIGPSIKDCCYEVGEDVSTRIQEASFGAGCVKQDRGSIYIDLQRANEAQALSMGILKENIWISQECTSCLPERYNSYRRSGQGAGRQYAVIGLVETVIPP